MRRKLCVATVASLLCAPLANAQSNSWSTAQGRVVFTIPAEWSLEVNKDGYDFVTEAYDDRGQQTISCFASVQELPNRSGASQDVFNQRVASRSVGAIAAKVGVGKAIGESFRTLGGVMVMQFAVEVQEARGIERQDHMQFGVLSGNVFYGVAASCASPISSPEWARSQIETFMSSLVISAE